MACGCDKVESLIPPRIIRPAWSDPLFNVATCDFSERVVAIGAGKTVVVAPANPNRWAIGFVRAQIVVSSVFVGPFADVAQWGFDTGNAGIFTWYKLFDYGPMVAYDWYGYSPNGESIRVLEVANV